MKDLKDIRLEIDNIDNEILSLLNKRAGLVIEVGKIKKESGAPVWVNSREEEIYSRLRNLNPGPFPQHSLRNVFREIISASLCLEEEIRVAYLGPVGTFSNLAAVKRFGQSAKLIPVRNIAEIFQGIEKGHMHYGIVPVENSLEGVVNQSLDMFMESNVSIFGEVYVEIAENLLNKTGRAEDIKKICSHSSPLGQCAKWLNKHFPDVELVPCESTAYAAEMAQKDTSIAAIGSELAEAVYNLKVIERHIEDGPGNYTRFVVIANKNNENYLEPTGNDKTSIMFSVHHKSGALYDVLEVFKNGNINMTTLESRPSKQKPWEYLFYTDIDGHMNDENIKRVINEFMDKAPISKILGSYPKGEF